MKFQWVALMSIAMAAIGSDAAFAQLPGGLISGGNGSAAAAAQDRVQTQVQQRVQAQVQQRVQAQVQQRLQSEIQSRVQVQAQARIAAEARRAAEIAVRAGSQAAAEAQAKAINAVGNAQLNVNASANTRTRANAGGNTARVGTNSSIGIGFGASSLLPPGVTQGDVAIYESIFGQFNPIRQQANQQASEQAAEQANTGADASNQASQAGASEQETPEPAEGQSPDQSGVSGLVNANLDFATRVQIAARQRRAQISEMRDQAIATGQSELLLQADAIEARLNAFASAQAEIQARGIAQTSAVIAGAGQTAADAAAQGSAEAQSQAAMARQKFDGGVQTDGTATSQIGLGNPFRGQANADATASGTLQGSLSPAERTAANPDAATDGGAGQSGGVQR
ncbi:MAG: hypothetical protein HKN47_06880 [Pirellulaceae bacterium]|nr:hypothetical protein [Pirellulaceae bacterium]